MYTWLAPFAVAAVLVFLYLNASTRANLLKNINFCMIVVMVTAAISMISNWNDRVNWLDWLAWIAAIIASGLIISRTKGTQSANSN